MKKSVSKLVVRRETIRALAALQLREARGAVVGSRDEANGCNNTAFVAAEPPV